MRGLQLMLGGENRTVGSVSRRSTGDVRHEGFNVRTSGSAVVVARNWPLSVVPPVAALAAVWSRGRSSPWTIGPRAGAQDWGGVDDHLSPPPVASLRACGWRGRPSAVHRTTRWMRTSACVIAYLVGFASVVAAVDLEVGYVQARPGDDIVFDVVLHSEGAQVAGTENSIAFSPNAPVLETETAEPDCWVNPAIDKSATAFAFFPFGCLPAIAYDCNGIRAIVIALDNVAPIPDGEVLYSCRVQVAADAPAVEHRLLCLDAGSASPDAEALETTCRDGGVLRPGSTPLPTRTPAPEPPRFAGTPCERTDECAFGECFDGACCVAGCDAVERCVRGLMCRPRCESDLDCGPHSSCRRGACYEVSDDTTPGQPTGEIFPDDPPSESSGGCMVARPTDRWSGWLLFLFPSALWIRKRWASPQPAGRGPRGNPRRGGTLGCGPDAPLGIVARAAAMHAVSGAAIDRPPMS